MVAFTTHVRSKLNVYGDGESRDEDLSDEDVVEA